MIVTVLLTESEMFNYVTFKFYKDGIHIVKLMVKKRICQLFEEEGVDTKLTIWREGPEKPESLAVFSLYENRETELETARKLWCDVIRMFEKFII